MKVLPKSERIQRTIFFPDRIFIDQLAAFIGENADSEQPMEITTDHHKLENFSELTDYLASPPTEPITTFECRAFLNDQSGTFKIEWSKNKLFISISSNDYPKVSYFLYSAQKKLNLNPKWFNYIEMFLAVALTPTIVTLFLEFLKLFFSKYQFSPQVENLILYFSVFVIFIFCGWLTSKAIDPGKNNKIDLTSHDSILRFSKTDIRNVFIATFFYLLGLGTTYFIDFLKTP